VSEHKAADQVQDFVGREPMRAHGDLHAVDPADVDRHVTYEQVMEAYRAGKLKPGKPRNSYTSLPNTRAKLAFAERKLATTQRHVRAMETQVRRLKEQLAEEERTGKVLAQEHESGVVAYDLSKLVIGPLKVIGYLTGTSVTPWWLASCVNCKVKDAYRGNALRAAAKNVRGITCRSCNASGKGVRVAGAK
jgi:hypothetical protein